MATVINDEFSAKDLINEVLFNEDIVIIYKGNRYFLANEDVDGTEYKIVSLANHGIPHEEYMKERKLYPDWETALNSYKMLDGTILKDALKESIYD